MKVLKSIAVAFSMYSRIPMPNFKWDSEDMKYHLVFFPWIGAVIGLLEYGLWWLAKEYQLPEVSFIAFAMAIPLLVTGGFHVDGFMDTADAMSSWQMKEKRLEILKDPHIGAFSVIHLVVAGLVFLASLSMINESAFANFCLSFFIARCLSGICVVRAKTAKEEGLLHTEAKTAGTYAVFASLLVELVICCCLTLLLNPFAGVVQVLAAFGSTVYYLYGAKKYFGGVTGDLAGWFVVVAEVMMALAEALVCWIG